MVLISQQGEVGVPMSVQAWRGILNLWGFFSHVFLQIIRASFPIVQMLFSSIGFSFGFGFRHPLLSKPLPVVEIPLPQQVSVPVEVSHAGDDGFHRAMEKLTVVLDLDETLVCTYETCSLPTSIRTQAIQAGLKWFELPGVSSDEENEGLATIAYGTVFERPGLQEFLRRSSEFADLVLFTAALEGYARAIVERIDPEKRFSLCLYRPSTVSTKYRENVKDLSCLSKDLSRTVIIDNNPFSFMLQPANGIPCVPFSARRPYDNQLLDVLLPLLEQLSLEKDVRPILLERFHMPEWFQAHGIPTTI